MRITKEQIILELKHFLIDLEANNDIYSMEYQVKQMTEDLTKYFKLDEPKEW